MSRNKVAVSSFSVGKKLPLTPGDPNLQRMREAQLAWQHPGLQRRLGHQQPDQVVRQQVGAHGGIEQRAMGQGDHPDDPHQRETQARGLPTVLGEARLIRLGVHPAVSHRPRSRPAE